MLCGKNQNMVHDGTNERGDTSQSRRGLMARWDGEVSSTLPPPPIVGPYHS